MSEDPSREWTVMVYFASDNDLTRDAILNRDAIQLVGSTEQVQIFIQLDPEDPFSPAERDIVSIGSGFTAEEITPDPNTGRVEDLVNFVEWVKQNGGDKAKKYLLVLWGHADGVDDDENDEQPIEIQAAKASGNGHSPGVSVEVGTSEVITLETVTIETATADSLTHETTSVETVSIATAKNIAASFGVDVHSNFDSLTNRELREAMKLVCATLGVEKIDLLGFDACLMSMVEVAQQLSDNVAVMVASEHSIPDKSWPYAPIIRKLVSEPTMTAQDLAKVMVDEYIADNMVTCQEKDCGSEPVQLSAFDLSKTSVLAGQVLALSQSLNENLQQHRLRQAIVKARRTSQTYFISDYVDLFHFCTRLKETLASPGFKSACDADAQACKQISDACQGVMDAIHKDGSAGGDFVLHSKINAKDNHPLANSHGVSIYFPLILPLYRNLEMCKTTEWDSFLANYMTNVFVPTEHPTAASNLITASTVSTPTLGGITMANPAQFPTVALQKGTTVTLPNNTVITLTGFSMLVMQPQPTVTVPVGTDLDLPHEGHKASTGTETKALPTGSRLGSPADGPPPGVEMVIPAATLRETAKANKKTDLPAGTKITTAPGAPPILVLANLLVK